MYKRADEMGSLESGGWALKSVLARVDDETKDQLKAEAKRYHQSLNTIALIKLRREITAKEVMEWLTS